MGEAQSKEFAKCAVRVVCAVKPQLGLELEPQLEQELELELELELESGLGF